ncbi:amino acid transporter AVT1C-like isoform X1 [Lingula anatina]|uniref:Amino acid transporter AVT1C-like isoform X1 n=1 Tax=Lingula anatina TaxID=7574 RepID=A0A1S3IYH0_LINAN|nr:amino acid transporter AVT1C-like isoform X1 [Lingula anatina]|eukprot:XP_013403250.1 amino acid transporter AVT1C-like isoform X1 [Lingula anatina]
MEGESKEHLVDVTRNINGETVSWGAPEIQAEDKAEYPSAGHAHHGLTVITACLFIAGEMAGSGVLALPRAVENSGWFGLVMIFVCCLISGYCGVLLGQCWIILQERWEEYRSDTRDPYTSIGVRAMGKVGKYSVSFANNVQLFGVGVVFLLLAAENIQSLAENIGHTEISFCYWNLLIAGFLTPFTWLGTPKDFWPIAMGAMGATAIACVILTANLIVDHNQVASVTVRHDPVGFTSFFMAFGTILFAFGGLSVFPTIQHDMKKPKEFWKSVTIGYSIVLCMYIPVSAVAYFFLGHKLDDNILRSVTPGPMLYIVEILLTLHLMMGLVLVLNPFLQELEEIFRVPNKFGWKRCLLRTCVMACVLFVTESIPHFGAILSLVGGSTVTFTTFICPPFFYLRLCAMKGDWREKFVPLHVKVMCWEIILIGLIGGIASTYSAILHLANTFVPPCYVNITAADAA